MRDSRVRVRIVPDIRTFREVVFDTFSALLRGIKAAAKMLKLVFRDLRNPPSPERLWIREHGRAEMAEAELWFARHIATAR